MLKFLKNINTTFVQQFVFQQSFVKFYQKKYGKGLDFWDKMVFFNFWHFLIIINDVLIISGTCLKLDKYYFIVSYKLDFFFRTLLFSKLISLSSVYVCDF